MSPPHTHAHTALTAADMKPLISLTGHISSFFELMRMTQHWAEQNGEQNYSLERLFNSCLECYIILDEGNVRDRA